jgi:hypothetical protein
MNLKNTRQTVIVISVAVVLILAVVGVTLPYFPSRQTAGSSSTASTETSSSLSSSSTSSMSTSTSSMSTSTSSMSTSTSLNLGNCPCGSTTTTSITYVLNPCNCTLNIPWPYVYQTTPGLAAASDYIVIANVTSISTVSQKPSLSQPGDSSAPPGVIPVTFYNITVIQTIEPIGGPPSNVTAGALLTVGQIGGVAGGTNMSVSGYPTLSVGSEYVFFLGVPGSFLTSYYVYHGLGTFVTVGGPQGLFYVQEKKVYSLDNLYPQADAWLPVKANGVPLAQFVSEVQSAWNSTATSAVG